MGFCCEFKVWFMYYLRWCHAEYKNILFDDCTCIFLNIYLLTLTWVEISLLSAELIAYNIIKTGHATKAAKQATSGIIIALGQCIPIKLVNS